MDKHNRFAVAPVAAALLLCFGPAAAAEDDDLAALIKPSSSVDVGVGVVSRDNQRFGQYSGLKDGSAYGLLDLYLVRREDATGTWMKLTGRNLGLDSRELRFEHNRQGDWGYFVDYSQTPRYDPFTVTTRLSGIGTSTQTVRGNAVAQEYHLKTERKAWSFGFDKEITSGLGVQLRFRDEDKQGSRLFGQGNFGDWRFLTEPIDYNTKQVEGTIHYTTPKLQVSGGYYGSWFTNNNLFLTVNNSVAGLTPMALPPGNASHQFNIAAGYNFTDTMRGTFKLVRGRATQTDAFFALPVATSGASGNLQARVENTQLQAGLSARPFSNLTLRGDYRYDNRADNTPVFVYFPTQATGTATTDGTNEPRSIRTQTAKFEASYRLPMGFRLTGGLGWEEKKRNSPPVRSVDFREKTDETTARVELRRAVSESVTGAIAYLHSNRGGSEWLPMTSLNGTQSPAGIAPLHLIDRDRDTLRMTVNWVPLDRLSLNARYDTSRDKYTGRGIVAFDIGPKKGTGSNLSLDAAYSFNDAVSGSLWYSRNENSYQSADCQTGGVGATANICTNNAANPVWSSDVRNISDTWGIGLRAKLTAKFDLNADLMDSKVRDQFGMNSVSPAASVVTALPNINTRVTTFKLTGIYSIDKKSGVRMFYVHDRFRTDDWTWANWTYNAVNDGGTTIRQNPNQKVDFIGAAYQYRFQ